MVLVGIVILLAALKAAAAIVVPLLLASMITLAFQPVTERLARRGVPRAVAAILTILIVLAALGGIGTLLGLAARDLAASAPRYGEQLGSLRDDVVGWMKGHGLGGMTEELQAEASGFSAGGILRTTVVVLTGLLGDLSTVLFLVVFIQLEASLLREKLRVLLEGDGSIDHVSRAIAETQKYLRVKALLSVANGVLLGLWCWIWGVSNPLLWGVIAFALNFVPIIGSLIAAILPVLFAVVELGLGGALGVVAGYVAVNLLVDNLLEPRLMGRAVGLSPLVLMISLLGWGYVLGPVGALLSVPLTVVVRIYLDSHPRLRRFGMMLAASTSDYQDLIRHAQATEPEADDDPPRQRSR